jgi:N-acetylmuramoyl-L-alanine amidase
VIAVKLSWLIPLVGISILSVSDAAWAGRLTYWKFNKALGRIELITDEGVRPQATFLPNPARIVLDLPNTSVRKSKQKAKSNLTKYVRGIRVGQFDRSTTRFVIELAPQYTVRASAVQIRNLAPNRWFLQLPSFIHRQSVPSQAKDSIAIGSPTIKLPPPSPPSQPPSQPSSPLPSPVDSNPVDPGSDPAASPPDSPPIKRGSTVVVIDPGHGGGDPGAVGINGLQEKVAVLSVSTQVAQQLHQKGIRAVLTRYSDREIDLAPRVATAERVNADIFVSIHANSISLSRQDISGLESYYYASAKGYRLARAIHNRILGNTNMQDRGIRQARFYVVRRTSMPSVLIEIGFVTGAQDAARLSSAPQRTKLAEAIVQGILDYLK